MLRVKVFEVKVEYQSSVRIENEINEWISDQSNQVELIAVSQSSVTYGPTSHTTVILWYKVAE